MATVATALSVFDAADSAANWSELSGHSSGAAPSADSENYFQNNSSVSQATGQATGTNAGQECDFGSAITWTDGWVIIAWLYYAAPTNLNTWTNGGHRMGVASSSGNMYYWKASGADFGDLPKAAWQNVAIDPNDPSGTTNSWLAADYTDGSPTGAKRLFGSLPNVLAKITKGSPHACDIIRYGSAEIYATGTGGNFAEYATANDGSTAKWGLFEAIRGGYLWKGLFSFGQTGTSLTFTDSNINILVDDTPRVQGDFNKMQNLNASTSVTWTNVNITGVKDSIAGTGNNAPGVFDFTTGTIDINGGVFTDLGTWTFTSQTIDDSTFRRCKSISSGGSTFTSVTFDSANDTEAVVVANLNELDECNFTIDATNGGHAVELTGAAATYIWNCQASGYDTGSSGNGVEVTGGSITGDETIHITATTGTFTISVSTGATTPSVSSAGAIVNVEASVTATVNVTSGGSAVEGSAVYLKTTGGTVVINAETNASGVATGSYSGSTPATIDTDVSGVKDGSGSTPYQYYTLGGTITASGYTADAILVED